MSDRNYNQFPLTLDRRVVLMDGYASVDTDGVVSADSLAGGTVSRVSAGNYKIVLTDHFARVLAANVQLVTENVEPKTVQVVSFKNGDTISQTNVNRVDFKVVDSNGAAVEVRNCGFTILLSLKNTSV